MAGNKEVLALRACAEEEEKTLTFYDFPETMHLVEGPFIEFVGRVSESDREKQKVTVLLSYFGKETPFVFDFLQVEKIEPFLP